VTDRRWTAPPSAKAGDVYLWAQNLSRQFVRGDHKDYSLTKVTLTAGTTSVIADDYVTTEASIVLMPTNAAAAGLSPYVSARSEGVSFTLTHGTAAGTETYDALVIR